MKNLFLIPVQSYSDVITNSSSELFIVNSDNDVTFVEDYLKKATNNYFKPEDIIRFKLSEYTEWYNNQWAYSDHYNEKYLRMPLEKKELFESISQIFLNPTDKNQVLKHRIDLLSESSYGCFPPFTFYDHITKKINHDFFYDENWIKIFRDDLIRFLNNNLTFPQKVILFDYSFPMSENDFEELMNSRYVNEELCKIDKINEVSDIHYKSNPQIKVLIEQFFEESEEKSKENPFFKKFYEIPELIDVRKLEGNVCFISGENAFDLDLIEKIENNLNARRIHLG